MRRTAWVAAVVLALGALTAAASAQDSFVGAWRGAVILNGMRCTFDLQMLADGTYGDIQRCGTIVTSQRGRYHLFPNNVIALTVNDWNPKQRYVVDAQPGGGHFEPNAKPPGGSYIYRFVSPSEMVWRDANFGGTITYVRVR